MKTILFYIMIFSLSFTFSIADITKKKVVYVNSYHSGYFWSDSIQKAILKGFNIKQKNGVLDFSDSEVELKILEMDTKRNSDEEYMKNIALKTKGEIDKYKPDLIITSDDNAVKYLIVPYYYNHDIPVIFTGVNASANSYGFPAKNITGMLEAALVKEFIATIKPYAKGSKIAYLDTDNTTSKQTIAQLKKTLNQDIKHYFVKTKDEWKESYLKAQDEVDILILGLSPIALDLQADYKEIAKFTKQHTKIPSVSWDTITRYISVLTFRKQPEEHGEWAANRALEVLNGRDISEIKIITNKRATIYINTSLSKTLNIVWPFFLMNDSILVE